jgi:hypothetical protein
MRLFFSTLLVALLVVTASAGAQRSRIILVPELTYGAEHEIYRDVLYARLSSGGNYFEHGWIELSPGVRYGLRAEVLTGSRSWGAFASYSARDAEMRSAGDEPQASFRMVQDAETQVFTVGVVRQLRLGARIGPMPAPELRVGLAALVMRVKAERRVPSLVLLQVHDFFSPGGQLSLGVVQRIAGPFDLRVQGGYALVRHDTEGLDGGGLPGSEPTLGHWASAFDVGLGVGVSF